MIFGLLERIPKKTHCETNKEFGRYPTSWPNDFFVMNFVHYCHIRSKIFLIFKLQARAHKLPFINMAFMSLAQLSIHLPNQFLLPNHFLRFSWISLNFIFFVKFSMTKLLLYSISLTKGLKIRKSTPKIHLSQAFQQYQKCGDTMETQIQRWNISSQCYPLKHD
jgi:hypothetical protein